VTVLADRFRLGVNYWPAETAMAWLPRYDGAVVRRDFRRIAEAGMGTVRIFLRWEDVQPTPAEIDRAALASVVDTADAAEVNGIDLVVTMFTGHMSGVNWIPAWATGGSSGDARFRIVSGTSVTADGRRLRNWYADADVVAAQERQAAAVAHALAGHPAVWAWDLGNENSNCTTPATAAQGEAWLERMTGALRSADPGTLVTIGTHMEDLEQDRGIGVAEAARWCDFVCMHGYPIYAGWATGPLDPDLVPFLQLLTRWLSGDAPVLFEELGHPTTPTPADAGAQLVTEGDAASWAVATCERLRWDGGLGALLWCFADYDPALHATPPFDLAVHERTFGLWRADGTPKPVVAALAALVGAPTVAARDDRSWIDVGIDEVLRDRARQIPRLYERYRGSLADR
jgi:endo-1,4-beta-mannosidase